MKPKIYLFLIVIVSLVAVAERSDSTSALIHTTVFRSIKIEKTRDFEMGDAYAGDNATVFPPDRGAQFKVSGEPLKFYNIVLPTRVTLTTGNGVGVEKRIDIYDFRSTPSILGRIGANGESNLEVGATRAKLLNSQSSGSYLGNFSVTVVYQ